MTTGVYVARDAQGEALYIGSAGNIEHRLASHRAKAQWWSSVQQIETIPTATRALAFYRERELIKELAPKHNRMARGRVSSRSRAVGPVVRPRPESLAAVIDAHGSVAALAEAVGISPMTLSDVWRGVAYPSSKLVARLVVVTGAPFDELFYIDPGEADVSLWLAKREVKSA